MGNVLSAIISYQLYDNWKKKSICMNTPQDKEYDKILKTCFLSEDSLQLKK
tara:strand:+ start:2101 stop:2253 length:153 start_codon:yes stop_codon:yes gene_type:complete